MDLSNYPLILMFIYGDSTVRSVKYWKWKIKKENKNNQENQKKIFVNWKDIDKNEKINREKIFVEKNGFLLKELLLGEKERLNPVIKVTE